MFSPTWPSLRFLFASFREAGNAPLHMTHFIIASCESVHRGNKISGLDGSRLPIRVDIARN